MFNEVMFDEVMFETSNACWLGMKNDVSNYTVSS